MTKIIKRMSKTRGLAPGTLVHIGEERTENPRISIIDYDKETFREKEAISVEECFSLKETSTVSWINIDGIHDIKIIEKLGNSFGLHPLILEDILNTGQRPKLEDFESYIFIVLKMLYMNDKKNEVKVEQVSIVLGPNFIISFQEKKGDVFDSIRDRIRNDKGRVRKMGADYLAYALIDAIVDNYFLILEKLGDEIEDLEETLVANPKPKNLQSIQNLKRNTIFLRKAVWPLREVISVMQRAESSLINESIRAYLRDIYDHTIQVIDTIETFRDMASGMLDIYLSSISNKMNEVMKVLTIIATIFIPLGFVAGLYGMNFNPAASKLNMPELNWPFGYMFAIGIMSVMALTMLAYFRRKRWL